MNSWALASLRRADDLLSRGVGLAVGDVLPDGRAEQHGILQHEADLIAQRLQRVAANVAAVDAHLSAQRVVEAGDEADQRGLAAAGRADERRRLARLDRRG